MKLIVKLKAALRYIKVTKKGKMYIEQWKPCSNTECIDLKHVPRKCIKEKLVEIQEIYTESLSKRVSTRSYEQGGNVHKTRWGEGQEWMENGIGRSEYRRGKEEFMDTVVWI